MPLLLLLALCAVASLPPMPSLAQTPIPSAPGHAFEIVSTERWLHARQAPAFTRWSEPDIRDWLHIDSVQAGPGPGTRTLRISQNWPAASTHLRLVHDSLGTVLEIAATYPTPARIEGQEYFDALREITRGLIREPERPGGFGSFEVDAMELVPNFHPQRLERGAEWIDSLHRVNAANSSRFHLTGRRHSRILGDTVVDGRTHWIVRDSARVRLEESWRRFEQTLDTVAVLERRAAGTIVGQSVHDPAAGLFLQRTDTIRLSGEVSLRFPDGRTYAVPARFERRRSWLRYDADAAAARREETLEAMRSRSGGMLRLPGDSLEMRLRAGDAALVESLVQEWHRARDPEERSRLRGLIAQGTRSDRQMEARLRALALQAGDTTDVLRQIGTTPGPLRPAELELALPLLADPGVALAFGIHSDRLYAAIREGLLRHPPVLQPDPLLWPCTPDGCGLLAAQLETPGDPRLRDLALITRFVMDPAAWEEAIRRRQSEGSALVRPAAQLLAGVGATWPLAAQLPLPPPDASWRAWLDWMGASHPDLPSPPARLPPLNPLRFAQSHFTALRFFEARTGRPLVQELRDRHAAADSDSARLVFGTILHGLGERTTDPSELARTLVRGSQAERTLALRELPGALRAAFPVSEAVAAEVIDRLLSIVIDGAPPWPLLHPAADSARRPAPRQIRTSAPILLLSDSVPASVRERWGDRVELLTSAEWEDRSPRREAMLLVPGSVLRNGPFLRVSIRYEGREERREDQSPAGYAGGFTVFLLEGPDGWVAVSESMWIT